MKSLNTIEMDYHKAIKQAEQLESLAGKMETQANERYPEMLKNLSDAWKGDNADEYILKAGALPEKMKRSAKDLKSIASTIRTIAKNTYDAEMEAYNIANERTY